MDTTDEELKGNLEKLLDGLTVEDCQTALVDVLERTIRMDRVAKATLSLLTDKDLNGPDCIALSAFLLATTAKTCPDSDVALQLFFKLLSKKLPQIGVVIQRVPREPKPEEEPK
jgi:hypothetical protein